MYSAEQTAHMIETCLSAWSVDATVSGISTGPRFTLFSLDLKLGSKQSRVKSLLPELARSISAHSVELIEYLPGSQMPGILVMNPTPDSVSLASMMHSQAFTAPVSTTTLMLGMNVAGEPVVADLSQMPHMLIAGTANAGKSVLMHAIIVSLLAKAGPQDVRLILVDSSMLEFTAYNALPHLLTPVITDPAKAVNVLHWLNRERSRRQGLFGAFGANKFDTYNRLVADAEEAGQTDLCVLPRIVVMIDDYADILSCDDDAENILNELCKRGHQTGIHLILTTKSPLPGVITRGIKANIPARIALSVTTKAASRQILDTEGAESLLGEGDMLFASSNMMMPLRIQGGYVADEEIRQIIVEWTSRYSTFYLDGICDEAWPSSTEPEPERDPLFDDAVRFIIDKRRASISGIQRQFRIGYNRAALIIEQLEEQGIVSEPDRMGNRTVY